MDEWVIDIDIEQFFDKVNHDKLDKELEQRGLRFTRYGDDTMVFTKSEMAANKVMQSITDWIENII